MLIETNNLTIGYKKNRDYSPILSNINLQIGYGKLIALVGTNGIGKSTLLKTFSGLLPPVSGNFKIENQNTTAFTPVDWAKICAVVLTETTVYQNITIKELISLGRQPYTNWLGALNKEDEEKIRSAMEVTGILNWADKNINELSDGQKQKVFIARAIAQDTPLILMDEPTTHLDFYNKIQFQKLVKKFTELGKTIIYSTHDLDLAIQLSDELIVLTASQVFHNTAEKLMQEKVFDSFFDTSEIQFDEQNKRFVVK